MSSRPAIEKLSIWAENAQEEREPFCLSLQKGAASERDVRRQWSVYGSAHNRRRAIRARDCSTAPKSAESHPASMWISGFDWARLGADRPSLAPPGEDSMESVQHGPLVSAATRSNDP